MSSGKVLRIFFCFNAAMQLIIIILKYICRNSDEVAYCRVGSKNLWARIIKMHRLQNETA